MERQHPLLEGLNGKLPARVQYVDLPYGYAPVEETQQGGWLEYWSILRRRRGAVLLFAVSGVLAAVLFSLPQTPVYQARTTLEVLSLNENVLNTRDLDPTAGVAEHSPELNIQTQVKILQSRALIERVLDKISTQHPQEQEGRLPAWQKALGLPDSAPQPTEEQRVRSALGSMKVQAIPRTRLVEVRYDSTHPERAAEFLNALSSEFINQNLEVRWNSSQRTGEWLTRQLEDLKIKLEQSEEKLQDYARTAGLVFTGEKENIADQKLRQLQEELSRAQADRAANQSRYEMARASPPEALPEVLDDKPMGNIHEKLTELRRQLAELGTSFTLEHPKVKRVQAQISEMEAVRSRHRDNVLARVRNEYETAARRERLIGREYAIQSRVVTDQAARSIQYNILKREVDTNRQLYEAILQKVKEYGIASAMQASSVRVVDPAKPPRLPYKPSYPLNSALGLIAGLFLGVVFVVARERTDRSLQAPGDVSLYLNLPELGVIPAGDEGKPHRIPYYRRSSKPLSLGLVGVNDGDPQSRVELVTWQQKPSLLAESFRSALASILFTGENGDRPRVIVVTSPNSREGKSTVVSNLGIALAEIRRKVLLIDADMRKPRLHDVFGVANEEGLSDLLRGAAMDQLPVHATGVEGLFVLPSGKVDAGAASLLHSPLMPALLERLRTKFDMVLIDTPPMLTMPDARVLGRIADGVALVVRANLTTREDAQAAGQRLADDGSRLLGTILNDWDPKKAGGYGYRGRYGSSYYDSCRQYHGEST